MFYELNSYELYVSQYQMNCSSGQVFSSLGKGLERYAQLSWVYLVDKVPNLVYLYRNFSYLVRHPSVCQCR